MNPKTLIVACGYAGDGYRIEQHAHCYNHHLQPFVIMSPRDSAIHIPGVKCFQAGRRAYIGQDSLDRQRFYMQHMAEWPVDWFLMNDSDSFCVSAKIPEQLYHEGSNVLWSNEVTEPRPHASPYPKLAFQPPYFFHRNALNKMLKVAESVKAHEITPYVDWWMNAVCHEAQLAHRSFGELEHQSRNPEPYSGSDPWGGLDYRIRYCGATMMHPIKTIEEFQLCLNARKFYEAQQS
jgi:hypothetical protein